MRSHVDASVRATELPVEPPSAGRARRFVSAALESWALDGITDEAVLLTSEVVTNALLHTSSEQIRLRLALVPGAIRVEVEDGSTLLPRSRGMSDSSATGRGLALVEAVARAWGADTGPRGKTVWFEIATPA